MSLRPNISGFRFKLLRSLLGSGREDTVAPTIKSLEEIIEFEDPEDSKHAANIIRMAIMEGVPFPDRPLEGAAHVFSAVALARHGQEHEPADSNFWKLAAFWDLQAKLKGTIESSANELLLYFENGG